MFIMLLLFWLIFNGRITAEILLVGIAVSAVLTYMWSRIFHNSRYTIIPNPVVAWRYIKYFVRLVIEIICCNIKVMSLILHPQEEIHPQLVTFRTRLRKETHKVILANSITLTPGTITVSMKDDTLCVHGLDASFLDGIEECEIVKRLEKMEEDTEYV